MEKYTFKQLLFFLCLNRDNISTAHIQLHCEDNVKNNILTKLIENKFDRYFVGYCSVDKPLDRTITVYCNTRLVDEVEIFGQVDDDTFVRLPKFRESR